jgi:hypothetical protein
MLKNLGTESSPYALHHDVESYRLSGKKRDILQDRQG